MGNTPYFSFPFPEGTDLVTQGDDAIQALAEAVETRINYGASLTIMPGESGGAADGSVDFPGAANMGGFTYGGSNFITYTEVGSRFFIVSASVEVEIEAPGGVTQMQSSLALVHNGNEIARSNDLVNTDAVAARFCTHTLTVPVQMETGESFVFFADSTPNGTIGLTSLRVYPIGPRLS